MRVIVDSDLCEGYGTCAVVAPELFRLDEWGFAEVVGEGEVAAEYEDAAGRALHECPMNAISVAD